MSMSSLFSKDTSLNLKKPAYAIIHIVKVLKSLRFGFSSLKSLYIDNK